MGRTRSVLALLGLLLAEGGAVALLVRLGSVRWFAVDYGNLRSWLSASPVEDILMGALRVVALVCACWLLVSTVLYVLALLSRVPVAVRAVGWMALPAVRRVAERTVVLAVATSTVVHPAGVVLAAEIPFAPAAPADAAATEWVEPEDVGVLVPPGVLRGGEAVPSSGVAAPPQARLESEAVPSSGVLVPPGALRGGENAPFGELVTPPGLSGTEAAAASDALVPQGVAEGVAPSAHTVVAGESLWTIAATVLAAAGGSGTGSDAEPGADVDDAVVGAYWVRLVDANRTALATGDPDRIFPGESIVLPPVAEAEQ